MLDLEQPRWRAPLLLRSGRMLAVLGFRAEANALERGLIDAQVANQARGTSSRSTPLMMGRTRARHPRSRAGGAERDPAPAAAREAALTKVLTPSRAVGGRRKGNKRVCRSSRRAGDRISPA